MKKKKPNKQKQENKNKQKNNNNRNKNKNKTKKKTKQNKTILRREVIYKASQLRDVLAICNGACMDRRNCNRCYGKHTTFWVPISKLQGVVNNSKPKSQQ